MAKKQLKPFTIIHNLEKLSDEGRAAYLAKVSEFMGLPPEMNALDMLWMTDEETSLKKYVPYARKGTTDILREIHGIKVLSMEQHDGPGYVSFKAIGVNPDGRQEVAIGAHGTEGLRGEKLAAAVMTAETRAGRRLTLKFVGAGILDESEAGAVTGNIAASGASLAQLAGSPVVVPPMPGAPSAATGRDITEKSSQTETVGEKWMRENPTASDFRMPTPEEIASSFAKEQQDLRDEAARQFRLSLPKISTPHVVEETIIDHDNGTVVHEEPEPEPVKKPAKRGRPRKKAGTVSFGDAQATPAIPAYTADTPSLCLTCGIPLTNHNYADGGGGYVCRPEDLAKVSPSPETASAVVSATEKAQPKTSAALELSSNPTPRSIEHNLDMAKIAAQPNSVPLATANEPEGGVNGNGLNRIPPLAEAIKASMFSPDPPFIVPPKPPQANPVSTNADISESQRPPTSVTDPVKLKEFRERLRQYSNVILPKLGGMLPSEGIGGAPNKLRAFALKFTGGADVEKLTLAQWEGLFDFLDGYKDDPKTLVKYIDESIGVK